MPVILVAEDEAFVRMLIADFLSDAGFSVLEAGNAEEALSVIASQRVDLVFSDINMPGKLNGESMANLLAMQRPKLPVLLTSGLEQPHVGGSGRRFIAKPYDFASVENDIRELLH